jgi:HK97 family phage prohead protease
VRFAGYAAVFDVPDRGGDVIRAGAFGARVRRVPLLWQHRGEPVGVIEAIGEDARGLRVTGRIDAPELAALVARGAVNGLSFGYRAVKARQGRWREIMALELCEVSLVARPMQGLARVHAVASAAAGPCEAGTAPPQPIAGLTHAGVVHPAILKGTFLD